MTHVFGDRVMLMQVGNLIIQLWGANRHGQTTRHGDFGVVWLPYSHTSTGSWEEAFADCGAQMFMNRHASDIVLLFKCSSEGSCGQAGPECDETSSVCVHGSLGLGAFHQLDPTGCSAYSIAAHCGEC